MMDQEDISFYHSKISPTLAIELSLPTLPIIRLYLSKTLISEVTDLDPSEDFEKLREKFIVSTFNA
jgi:hypothetical protein